MPEAAEGTAFRGDPAWLATPSGLRKPGRSRRDLNSGAGRSAGPGHVAPASRGRPLEAGRARRQRRRASRRVRERRRGSRSLPFRLARRLLLRLDLHLSWPLSPPDALLVPRTDAMAAAGEWTRAGVLSNTLSFPAPAAAAGDAPADRGPAHFSGLHARTPGVSSGGSLSPSPLAALCHLRPAGQSRRSEPAPSSQAGTAERPPPQPPRIWAPRAGSTLAPLLVVGHQPLWRRSRREPVYLLLRSLIRSNHGRRPALTSALPARAPLSANSAPVWTAELPWALEREGASWGGRGAGRAGLPARSPRGQRTEESAQPCSRRPHGQGTRLPRSQAQGPRLSPVSN